MRFLGLGLTEAVPDANTIWNFREALKRAGAIEVLFARFDAQLRGAGYLAMSGSRSRLQEAARKTLACASRYNQRSDELF